MEKFFSLPIEKQNRIIDAALTVFSRNVYKKASVGDIAKVAGISKGMVFYYFGSKKNLYLYLVEFCSKLFMNEMKKSFKEEVTDFFDRIRMGTEIKMAVMRKHPAIFSFFRNMYLETDKDVKNDITALFSGSEGISGKLVFDGVDLTKFKDDVDPKLLYKFLIWAAEGVANGLVFSNGVDDIDVFVQEFYQCLVFMENNFYKDHE